MGNLCCGLRYKSSSYSSSSMVWAAGEEDDDEWVSVVDCVSKNASIPNNNKPNIPVEKQSLLELGLDSSICSSSSAASASDHDSSSHDSHRREQVKIKISKKELEELLGRRGGDDHVHSTNTSMSIPLDQLLSRLLKLQSDREDLHMNNIHHHHFDQRSAWRPILQTIPELN